MAKQSEPWAYKTKKLPYPVNCFIQYTHTLSAARDCTVAEASSNNWIISQTQHRMLWFLAPRPTRPKTFCYPKILNAPAIISPFWLSPTPESGPKYRPITFLTWSGLQIWFVQLCRYKPNRIFQLTSRSVMKRSILPVFNMANMVWATLRACRQLWYLTGR